MNSEKLVQTLGFQPFRPWPFDKRLIPTDRDWHRTFKLLRCAPVENLGGLRCVHDIDKLLCQPGMLVINGTRHILLPRMLEKEDLGI
jgi:dTDP-4-dehydrorhamnose reductase